MAFFGTLDTTLRFTAVITLVAALVGCHDDSPRVVSAELLEVGEPENDHLDRTIRVRLDRPLDEVQGNALLKSLRASQPRVSPEADVKLLPTFPDPARKDTLDLQIIAGTGPLETEGLFSGPDGKSASTGLSIDLGLGRGAQWVDLQRARREPSLGRAVWLDQNRNLIVDREDRIRLIFDRAVKLADASPAGPVVDLERDIYLSNRGDDRLDDHDRLDPDDDATPSRFVPPLLDSATREVHIELGSNPRLIPTRQRSRNVYDPLPGLDLLPTGIAIHGTSLQPMDKIVDRFSGVGAISRNEVVLELPPDHPQTRPLSDGFPDPGPRSYLTATVHLGNRVLLIGGRREASGPGVGDALDQILVFDPAAPPQSRLRDNGSRLRQARLHHTTTVLPGPDGSLLTPDDLIICVGGMTSEGLSLSSLEVLRAEGPMMDYRVEAVEGELETARYHHTATRLSGNRILVVGGVSRVSRSLEEGVRILGTAEILSFDVDARNQVWVRRVAVLRTAPRARHSATDLGATPAGDGADGAILLFGGIGASEVSWKGPDSIPWSNAIVTSSAEIVRISTDEAHSTPLALPYGFTHQRYDHTAVLLKGEEADPESPGADAAGVRTVLICGGSRLLRSIDGRVRVSLPRNLDDPILGALFKGGPELERWLTAPDWLRLGIDLEAPTESSVEVLPSPFDRIRTKNALVTIPGLGVLALGGELGSVDVTRRKALVTGEVYVPDTGSVSPFSIFLSSGRSGFAWVLLQSKDRWTLALFGGIIGAGQDGVPLADVELLEIPR